MQSELWWKKCTTGPVKVLPSCWKKTACHPRFAAGHDQDQQLADHQDVLGSRNAFFTALRTAFLIALRILLGRLRTLRTAVLPAFPNRRDRTLRRGPPPCFLAIFRTLRRGCLRMVLRTVVFPLFIFRRDRILRRGPDLRIGAVLRTVVLTALRTLRTNLRGTSLRT